MASSAANKSLVARAAAILTTGEVSATALDLNKTWGSTLCVDLDFTIGSLTNVIVKHYASSDGSTWKPISAGGAVLTETITATATRSIAIPSLAGFKFYKTTLTGTGTVTSSTATLTYRWLAAGSQ